MKFKIYEINKIIVKILSCSMLVLALNVILPKLKQTHQNLIGIVNNLQESSQQSPNSETNTNNIDQQTNQTQSSTSTDHRLNLIKDTLNFNLCSQSDLVRIIQDIQQLKQLNPQQQSFNLSYSKMEREDGNLLQQFSEFEYLNEILDSEQITLNITQLEIDYLFDERLETYYNQTIPAEYPVMKNAQLDNYIYNKNEQQSSSAVVQAPRNSVNDSDAQGQRKAKQILPSICIHKKLFVSFILFQNYNFQQFSFQKDSNLEYTQALLVQNQPYLNTSNSLNLMLPSHILVFHSKKIFNQFIQTNFKLLLWIQVFDKKISPYIHYLKQYTLMDIWLDD